MPLVPRITKGPSASFSHVFDYRGWEQLQGDTPDEISSATATVDPSGLTLGSPGVNADGNQVSVQLSSGTTGTTYRVTVLATTAAGDVLDAYLDVTVGLGVDGAVLYPSQFGPFVDTKRAMSLLHDEDDLDDDEAVPAWATVDGNERAFYLANAAWREIVQACARGKIYTVAELTDYANDPVRGLDLVNLAADIFWCRLVRRRRYTPGDPQEQASECKEAQERLQMLRQGERIFDLTGVTNSTTGGVYGSEVAEAGAISVGRLGGQRCEHGARRFWGCMGDDAHTVGRPSPGDPRDRPGC